MPESLHTVMWLMSDRALPRSFRMMQGFGVHTFRFVNEKGKSHFVKFHWKPKQGMQSTLWDEAVKISGADSDYFRRDLYEAIQSGSFPEWELGVQVFDQKWADKQDYDVLDATKLIPEESLPVKIVGRMVLDRYPDNFFAETRTICVSAIQHYLPALISRTTLCYKGVCFPIWIHRNLVWERSIFIRSRLMHHAVHSAICSGMA